MTRSYLGVDGGGSKTGLTIITADGEIVASIRAPGCYYLGSGSTEGQGCSNVS